MGGGGRWWARWPETFWLGSNGRWSLSLQSPPLPLSPSRPSRACVRVRPPATGSGPTRPAGLAVAGRRPSYPSSIQVERAATRGAAGRGACCPVAAGAAPGQVCAAGPSRSVRASPRAGGWDQNENMPWRGERRRPSVPAAAQSPLVPPKVSAAASSSLVPAPGAYCTVVSESGWAEPPFLQVDGFVAYVCRASCCVVVTGPLRSGTACFVLTRSMSTPPTGFKIDDYF